MLRVVTKYHVESEAWPGKDGLEDAANILLIIKHELTFYVYFYKPYYQLY